MYKYSTDKIMEEIALTEIIEDFKLKYLPRFKELEKYYDVKNNIKNRVINNNKPNNKISHGFAKYITNMATGYFMGKPLKYIIDDENLKNDITEILDNNYTNNTNFEIAKEASKCGISYEILYINEKAQLKMQKFKAEDIIPIYSTNIGEFLESAIRIWNKQDIGEQVITEYAQLYTKHEIITYSRIQGDGRYKLIDIENHNFSDVPVIVYWNNEEQKGDYEDIITLIDAYDKSQSDTANDFEYFTDAYLVIIGAGGGITGEDGEEEQTKASRSLKENRILNLDEKGQAEWLIKNINDTAVENFKNRLYKDIFFLTQVPSLSDESFAGNLSGVAIRYKLIGLEELAIMKENKFYSAQKKKLKLMTEFLNTKNNKNYNANVIKQKYERNFIDNLTEIIENVSKLENIISKQTQLEMLPIVEDAQEEMEKIEDERLKQEGLTRIPEDFNLD